MCGVLIGVLCCDWCVYRVVIGMCGVVIVVCGVVIGVWCCD